MQLFTLKLFFIRCIGMQFTNHLGIHGKQKFASSHLLAHSKDEARSFCWRSPKHFCQQWSATEIIKGPLSVLYFKKLILIEF